MGARTGGFGRADRLRCSREFRRVSERGRRVSSASFVALIAAAGGEAGPRVSRQRLGVTVSKKVGNSVVRNRVKRRIREWFRAERGLLTGAFDVVIIARPAAGDLAPGQTAVALGELLKPWRVEAP